MQAGHVSSTQEEARALNALGAEMRRLWAEGVAGRATITAMHDPGERLAGNKVLELDLLVTVPGRPPYAATLRTPIGGEDTAPYAVGTSYNVRVDRADPHRLTFAA